MSGGALAISAGPDLGVTMAPDRQVHGNGGRVQSGCRFPSASRDESKVCRVGPGTAHAPTENEQRKMENADRRHWRQVMSSYQQPAPEAAEGEWWTYMEEASPSTLAWLSILRSHDCPLRSHGCPFAKFRLKIAKWAGVRLRVPVHNYCAEVSKRAAVHGVAVRAAVLRQLLPNQGIRSRLVPRRRLRSTLIQPMLSDG